MFATATSVFVVFPLYCSTRGSIVSRLFDRADGQRTERICLNMRIEVRAAPEANSIAPGPRHKKVTIPRPMALILPLVILGFAKVSLVVDFPPKVLTQRKGRGLETRSGLSEVTFDIERHLYVQAVRSTWLTCGNFGKADGRGFMLWSRSRSNRLVCPGRLSLEAFAWT